MLLVHLLLFGTYIVEALQEKTALFKLKDVPIPNLLRELQLFLRTTSLPQG